MNIDRDELRKLAEAATPGPWEVHGSLIGIGRAKPDFGQTWGVCWRQDIEFICASRQAVPELLDALDKAEARIKAVRELHQSDGHEPERCGRANCFPSCAECVYDYPCPTIRALDGTVTPDPQ